MIYIHYFEQEKEMSIVNVQELPGCVRITMRVDEPDPNDERFRPLPFEEYSKTDPARYITEADQAIRDTRHKFYKITDSLDRFWRQADERASELVCLKMSEQEDVEHGCEIAADVEEKKKEMAHLTEIYKAGKSIEHTMCHAEDDGSELVINYRWFCVHYRILLGELPNNATVYSVYGPGNRTGMLVAQAKNV